MKKISVIMASFLGAYGNKPESPTREKKFIRAVNSFLNQTYQNKELIIISDQCTRTYEIYMELWGNNSLINCVIIPKQPIYGGEIRNEGLRIATGDIICYLDNDDVLGKTHLETIVKQFTDDVDWVYYDDYLVLNNEFNKFHKRFVETRYGQIGTSSISHRNLKVLKDSSPWVCGYGHDFIFVVTLASKHGLRFKKLEQTPSYLVCHWGGGENSGDF